MCSSSSSKKANKKSQQLSEQQFQWQKDQAAKAEADALARRQAMAEGLTKINQTFGGFNDDYYGGIQQNYLDYANPQIAAQQVDSTYNVRSNLANSGKLGSSTQARQYGDIAETFGGIYRDSQIKAEDYANQHRSAVDSARSSAINQMYASESGDVGLQAANASAAGLLSGPSYEPISNILGQAAKFATIDYNNSLYNAGNGGSNGVFSRWTNPYAQSQLAGGKTTSTIK